MPHRPALASVQAAGLKRAQIGAIAVPPKYASGDFRKASYWSLRGKLDVPKERFFSLPGCERDGDRTLVIGWAGLDHRQRAQAIAAYYLQMKETEGWDSTRLLPLLVALDELIPWLKQWHNELDAMFGQRMGDYFDSFLQEELRSLAVSRSQLGEWEPMAAGRGKRR